jgi:hypothetical protein
MKIAACAAAFAKRSAQPIRSDTGIKRRLSWVQVTFQSRVYDRSDNVLDLDGLTYHSRVLKLELNAVMGTKPPKEDLLVNSPEAAGLRLEGPAGLSWDGAKPRLMRDRSLPTATRLRIRWLKLYSRFWLLKRGLPLRSKPQTNGDAPSGEADGSAVRG